MGLKPMGRRGESNEAAVQREGPNPPLFFNDAFTKIRNGNGESDGRGWKMRTARVIILSG